MNPKIDEIMKRFYLRTQDIIFITFLLVFSLIMIFLVSTFIITLHRMSVYSNE